MQDILIYVPIKYRNEFHKDFDEDGSFSNKISTHEIDKDWEHFWSFQKVPLGITIGKSKAMFTDGKNVIAEGIIIDCDDKNIFFKSLTKVKYPQPKKAPTRGFTYVGDNMEKNICNYIGMDGRCNGKATRAVVFVISDTFGVRTKLCKKHYELTKELQEKG